MIIKKHFLLSIFLLLGILATSVQAGGTDHKRHKQKVAKHSKSTRKSVEKAKLDARLSHGERYLSREQLIVAETTFFYSLSRVSQLLEQLQALSPNVESGQAPLSPIITAQNLEMIAGFLSQQSDILSDLIRSETAVGAIVGNSAELASHNISILYNRWTEAADIFVNNAVDFVAGLESFTQFGSYLERNYSEDLELLTRRLHVAVDAVGFLQFNQYVNLLERWDRSETSPTITREAFQQAEEYFTRRFDVLDFNLRNLPSPGDLGRHNTSVATLEDLRAIAISLNRLFGILSRFSDWVVSERLEENTFSELYEAWNQNAQRLLDYTSEFLRDHEGSSSLQAEVDDIRQSMESVPTSLRIVVSLSSEEPSHQPPSTPPAPPTSASSSPAREPELDVSSTIFYVPNSLRQWQEFQSTTSSLGVLAVPVY